MRTGAKYLRKRLVGPSMLNYYPREVSIAKLWHCLDNNRQFSYRDALHDFAGGKYASQEWKVPEWVKEMYSKKAELRAAWKQLERSGEAVGLLKGVGEKGGEEGLKEWVELMRYVLKKGSEAPGAAARL